jgi:Fe-S cluster assembly iron-binding protein IscA
MAQFFQVKVQFRTEDDKGKIKKENVSYLVDAMSVSEAEARIVQYLTERGEEEFEVKAASESKIAQVVMVEEAR